MSLWNSWQYKITFFHTLQQLWCVCDLYSVTFCKELENIWEWAEGCSQYFLKYMCSLITSAVSLGEKMVKKSQQSPTTCGLLISSYQNSSTSSLWVAHCCRDERFPSLLNQLILSLNLYLLYYLTNKQNQHIFLSGIISFLLKVWATS